MRQTPHDTNSSHILKTISLFHYSILFTTCTITSPQFSLAQSFMLSSRTINNKYTRPISTVYIQDGRQVLLIFSQLLCLPLWLHRFSYGMRQDWSDSYCACLCGFIGSVTVCARIGRTIPSGVQYPGWDTDINSAAYAMRLISQAPTDGLPLSSLICEW